MQDELDLYLKNRYPDNYWSGEKDCNLLIWGVDGTIPRLCSLNYGIEYEPLSGDVRGKKISNMLNEDYDNNSVFRRLISYGTQLSKKCSIPFVVIVYPSMRKDYDGKWEETEHVFEREHVIFHWYKLGEKGECFSGRELRNHIYNILGKTYEDTGTSKKENSHLSDYFHFWSRMSLSRNVTKLDIDGIILDDSGKNGVLVEIKRSSVPPIPKWKPYVNDKANYVLESRYAKAIDAYFWLLHHESRACNENEVISFYDIKDVNEKEPENFLITDDINLEYNLTGDNSLDYRIEKFIHR